MRRLSAIVVTLAVIACSTPPRLFLHRAHRVNFALTEQELMRAQFFVDTEVLAHGVSEGTPAALLIRKGTPGAAVSVGPNWIRVRFQEGSPGVFFATDPSPGGGSVYVLATQTADGVFERVADQPEQKLSAAGQEFRVIYGEYAQLQIDGSYLEDLIDRRATLGGARPR